MGFGGISVWQLVIILVIVILLFGTKKLRNVGSDLGGAIKSFKKSVREGEGEGTEKGEAGEGETEADSPKIEGSRVVDAESHHEDKGKEKEKQA